MLLFFPRPSRIPGGFRASLRQRKTPGARNALTAGQKEHFGVSQSHQTCWAPPEAAEEGQLMRKVKDPAVLHPTNWPNFAHTKQEKSVFEAQLRLSITK